MKKIKELDFTDLKNKCDINEFTFAKTTDLEPFQGIIGQERALNAITSALKIKEKGFNLYVSGNVGIGKTFYALSVANGIAKNESVPNDYCYIHNFENPNEPINVSLEPGQGIEFKLDMNRFVSELLERLAKDLSGDKYEKEKKSITDRYTKMRNNIISELDRITSEQGFKIQKTEAGIYFSPMYNGAVINEKEFNNLDPNVRKQFEEKSPKIQELTLNALKDLEKVDKERAAFISDWNNNLATFAVTQCMGNLKLKYKGNLKIQNFLYSIQSDVINNLDLFRLFFNRKTDQANAQQNMSQGYGQIRPDYKKPWESYRVNLIVDNDKLEHAPVIVCKDANYFDLFGKLEFETTMQGTKTNYMMLKPGLIHKANGGYLVVNVKEVVNNPAVWEAFKRVIRNQALTIDSSRDIAQPITIVTLKPEPIPINIQFILIGSEQMYQQLCSLDVDFKKLFKIKAEFDDTYERTDKNVYKLAQYVAFLCEKHKLLPFTSSAIAEIVEYSSKCANDKNKLNAVLTDIVDLTIESNHIAKTGRKKIVTSEEVIKAINTKIKRLSKYDENIQELISDGTILISTEGEKVGQINGLTILNTGDFSFGKPVRITANTFIGKSGVLNIEREVAMSGNSHSKGVYILAAYIGEKYAQDMPLSLTASICFEQLYNGVDGDSASSTELYAILSSLAGVPIKQSLAVTGSVNQKGEIQPIGGVSDKIEGFYNICKNKEITGEQGVLIPHQNIKSLSLSEEIIEAVKTDKFHIYPVNTIDDGIEILTGLKAGKLLDDGTYEKDSINYLVQKKLRKYAEKSMHFKS